MARHTCTLLREMVIALLNAGTGPRLVDNELANPLHHLYHLSESSTTVARALLGHGADVNANDEEGFISLHYACRLYDSQSLRTRGISQMSRWRSMSFSGFLQPSLQSKLMLAFETTVEAVTALLDHGADVNARTRAGETALDISEHLARWWDFANVVYASFLDLLDRVEELERELLKVLVASMAPCTVI
ncbi:hypothetical protein ARMSODRAFT_959614 [Armillaria solidipes]|uniref:Uncharacterized protein n=1 Tax=Armillaria solidipes TaxID=1076256 RepID=A0A2H3BST6_9AGAR|nr:hypothetical protein ARMSODRAFT_959614 [Armillaria solidipes]